MRIAILFGSYRDNRQGIKAARFAKRMVEKNGHEAVLIDAKEREVSMLKRRYKNYEKPPENLQRIHEELTGADGFLIVAGEYNHGPQPGLKNLVDHFMPEYFFKPSGIICYSTGGFGGVRAMVQWRSILCEVGMPSISSHLPISKIKDSLDDEGLGEELEKRSEKFFKEFFWYAKALKDARSKGVPY